MKIRRHLPREATYYSDVAIIIEQDVGPVVAYYVLLAFVHSRDSVQGDLRLEIPVNNVEACVIPHCEKNLPQEPPHILLRDAVVYLLNTWHSIA